MPSPSSWPARLAGPALAVAGVGATAAASVLLRPSLGLASLALLFIIPVMVAAAARGLASGLIAAGASALAFNFFLVEPRWTLRIADRDNLLTTALLFLVALVVSRLAGNLRAATAQAQGAADDQRLLAAFSTAAAGLDEAAVLDRLRETLAGALGAEVQIVAEGEAANPLDRAAAGWAVAHREPAGRGTGAIATADALFVPVVAGEDVAGLFAVALPDGMPLAAERWPLARGLATAAGQAIARGRLAAEAAAVTVAKQRGELSAALLSSVGHDLRTPLTVILGEAHAIGAAPIVAAAERLRRRIDNLLGMARVEAGAVTVRREAVDLADAVASALGDAGPALAGRAVAVALPPDLPLVAADPGLLHHVLLNLLDNAAKFSDAGVEIAGVAAGDRVELSIGDRGPGLPGGQEEAVFDRFRRFAGSDRTGGSGLGLAIARAFSRGFGAEVRAANRDGGGARFTVSLQAHR